VDGAAERGDAVGDRPCVLEQVFGEHPRTITAGAGPSQRRVIGR
jgi:hypothetical protein